MNINEIEVMDVEIVKVKKDYWWWSAIKSRFKKSEESWVKERREICLNCVYNSKNYKEKKTFKQKTLKFFSDLLTLITFSENEDLGECLHENCGCPIFFSTTVFSGECPEGKWKSIYIPNSSLSKK